MNAQPTSPEVAPTPRGAQGTPPVPQHVNLPPIRTMADDLAALQRGSVPAGGPQAAGVPTPVAITARGTPGKNIALPGSGPHRGPGIRSIVLGIVLALALSGSAWLAWTLVPRASGTIADLVPAEALAFFSVERGGDPLTQHLVAKFTSAFDASPALLGEGWSELAYVLLPGGSPSEPVAALLVTGKNVQPNVQGAAHLAVRNLPAGGVAIIDGQSVGRLDGVTDNTLGRDRAFRKLAGLFRGAPAFLYLREGTLPSVLGPFALFPVSLQDAVLLAITPATDGGAHVLLRGVWGTRQGRPPEAQTWEPLLRSLPPTVVSLVARSDVGGDIDTLRVAESGNPALQEFFRSLAEQGSATDALREHVAGPYAAGTLPTTAAGVRDGIAVILLKEGAERQVLDLLRPLEDAFRHLDIFLTGSGFPAATFAEAVYSGVTIRYANFWGPERAFDYAVGDSLLLVGTSRESMRAMVDALQGTGAGSLRTDPAFRSLAETTRAGAWQYVRVDPSILGELPPPWQTLLGVFHALSIAPTGERTFSGTATLGD